jgi:hypothetical protein
MLSGTPAPSSVDRADIAAAVDEAGYALVP